jgi:hypothetical protein
MDTSALFNLDSLTDLELRSRVDMRPTLLRVLTDLYVQKSTHTADEERHYTELALRLIEVVDVPTRIAAASRLGRHDAPPLRVIQCLAGDLPEVAAAVRSHVLLRPAGGPPHGGDNESTLTDGAPETIGADIANELNELFFAADAETRRLILRNLEIVASHSAGRARISRDQATGKRLEAAALARSRQGFAQQLALSLHIPREQALRIARDDLGEPIVVAAKALNVPRDMLYRILLFINTAIGHSVERVHTLAELYDDITVRAAEDVVAIWQALPDEARGAATQHQPLTSRGEPHPRAAAALRMGAPAAARKNERRDAS